MLAQAVKTAKAYKGAFIRVIGNQNPSEDKGLDLLRAKAVGEKLIKEYGLSKDSVIPELGKSGNRTVEVYVQQ